MKEEKQKDFDMSDYVPTPRNKYDLLRTESEQSQSIEESEPNVNSDNTLETTHSTPSKGTKKNLTSKQRKASLQEYQETFLVVPKITDRKTVFISNEFRERIVEVVLRLGTEKSSVSGFVENLIKAHLSDYEDYLTTWRKL